MQAQEKTPSLESSAWFMCAHRLHACELLLAPPSPLTASSKALSCSSQEIPASWSEGSTSAAGGETQGTWAVSAGMHLLG